jgi:hypothetical protein
VQRVKRKGDRQDENSKIQDENSENQSMNERRDEKKTG